jgi:hypothetical protein
MKNLIKDVAAAVAIAFLLFSTGCGRQVQSPDAVSAQPMPTSSFQPPPTRSPSKPDLQAELLDDRNKTSSSPLANFDFKNHSYPLPRGWQNPDGADAVLTDGHLEPVSADTDLGMEPEQIAEARARRRIGLSYVTTKYLDVTGDGQDEALVILKVETTGSAIPQLVYVYEWKVDKPELIWYFRTGDRADGGLKDIRMDNGRVLVELYGQDRFLLGEVETNKITGDEEQICCPTFFTRTFYKWNGKHFQMEKDRWTIAVNDPSAQPQRNLGEIVNNPKNARR